MSVRCCRCFHLAAREGGKRFAQFRFEVECVGITTVSHDQHLFEQSLVHLSLDVIRRARVHPPNILGKFQCEVEVLFDLINVEGAGVHL
ncbi:MAG: hypothetical protein ACK5LO_16990 [Leucobacter sp.]